MSVFFIRRPVFAAVIALLVILMGVVAYPTMPVAQYPDITPPVIQVSAVYPGANAQVVADTVASPIEQEVNGVPGMIYMESTSASDGSYTLKVTFELGTEIDIASVLVQNRVSIAEAKLPEEVRRNGVTTDKVSSTVITVFSLAPVNEAATEEFDDLFLSNYMTINMLDEVRRIQGVGDASVFPVKDYGMRIWLDPERLKARNLTTMDVIGALREQNVQVAAGVIGQAPAPQGLAYQYAISTLGRLDDVEQFEDVIVRADGDRLTRVRDVARVELGSKSYDVLARSNGVPAAVMIVYQAPGGNAVQVSEEVEKLLEAKRDALPAGLEFSTIYNTAEFVVSAIEGVYQTFVEALVLVLLVVIVFLGSLRASIIPMVAIPVSIIGTFFFASLFGFSINMPVLFGLVLAIGIVVDDAIVVVENVERIMRDERIPRREATEKAMGEVIGPVFSTTLVMMAVFVPASFLPGISGQLFRQFAITIAVSTGLSSVAALTLSPALCGLILKAREPGDEGNWFVRSFDRVFDTVSGGYARLIRLLTHRAVIGFTLLGFAACLVLTVFTFTRVPTGFVPEEDRGLVLVEVWLPDSASQERTLEAAKKVERILSEVDGIENYTVLPGYSFINQNGSNYAMFFAGLEDWSVRLPKGLDFETIMADIRARSASVQDGLVIVYSLPAVDGVGNATGFDLRVQDRAGVGRMAMQEIVQNLVANGNAQSKLTGVNSAYRSGVAQLYVDVDRERVKKLGIPLEDVFATMSGYLGSAYVNDFNLFGRTWQVNVSADSRFRANPEDILSLEVRKPDGVMVPLGGFVKVDETMGPDRVVRYNLFPSAVVQGQPAIGVSSGEALTIMDDMTAEVLPPGVTSEWTALSYQERQVGNQAIIVFGMAMVIVYLILAALYESWFTPLAVILSIPLAVLGAMLGLMLRGMDNNIYTQVGLVLLVGLGAKNAILIVEFARAYRLQGKSIIDSAVEASRLRLRAILMTAFSFILGVLPLMIATGAGAASRQAIGTAVFFGMLGNTMLGLIFTPVLYVLIQWFTELLFGAPKAPEPNRSEDDGSPAPVTAH